MTEKTVMEVLDQYLGAALDILKEKKILPEHFLQIERQLAEILNNTSKHRLLDLLNTVVKKEIKSK